MSSQLTFLSHDYSTWPFTEQSPADYCNLLRLRLGLDQVKISLQNGNEISVYLDLSLSESFQSFQSMDNQILSLLTSLEFLVFTLMVW